MEDGRLSAAERMAFDELAEDLAQQLEDGLSMPAAIAVAADASVIAKIALPLDTGGEPISDAQIGGPLIEHLRQDGIDPTAVGFVRIDTDLPYINVIDLDSGRVTQGRPLIKDTITWETSQHDQLDNTPTGGSEGTLIEFADDSSFEEAASQALGHIGEDSLRNLVALVDRDRPAANSEVPDDLIYDGGAVWAHGEVPAADGPESSLGERLRQLRDHAASVPSNTVAVRFHHQGAAGDFIYVFGYYEADGGESRFLARTTLIEPGLLGETEHVAAEELEELLESDERS